MITLNSHFLQGRSPIIKNIIVRDEQGREYAATYLKRAEGLVKKGRARWISDNEICLACPPTFLEDKKMNEDKTMIEVMPDEHSMTGEANVNSANGDIFSADSGKIESAADCAEQIKPDLNYVMSQIHRISKDIGHVMASVKELGATVYSAGPEDIGAQAKAEAIADIVKHREETNRRLIQFYEKMYDDLKPRRSDAEMDKKHYIDSLIGSLTSIDEDIAGCVLDLIHTLINENASA